MTPDEITPLLLVFILGIWLMWLLPKPCEHKECERLHQRLAGADRVAKTRKRAQDAHNQWHSKRHPEPGCEWCEQ